MKTTPESTVAQFFIHKYWPQKGLIGKIRLVLADVGGAIPPFTVPWHTNAAGQKFYADHGAIGKTISVMEKKLAKAFNESVAKPTDYKIQQDFINMAADMTADFDMLRGRNIIRSAADVPEMLYLSAGYGLPLAGAVAETAARLEKISNTPLDKTTRELKTKKIVFKIDGA